MFSKLISVATACLAAASIVNAGVANTHRVKTALLVIDIQNSFLPPNGSLAVTGGNEIIPIVNRLMDKCHFDLIVASQDWHPKNHVSFYTNHPGTQPFEIITYEYLGMNITQELWPPHCIIDSHGAQFASNIHSHKYDYVVRKGYNPMIDSYSGLADNVYLHFTNMSSILFQHNIERVYVVGLAADFCVKFTSIDAAKFNFATNVIKEATRAVVPSTINQAFQDIESFGGKVVSLNDSSFTDFCPRY